MKRIFFIALITLLSNCKDGDLGNNYYYLSKEEALDIGYPYGSILYKSSQKNSFEKILINGDISNCISDKNYILAIQRPNINLYKKQILHDFKSWDEYYSKNKKDSIVDISVGKLSLNEIHKILKKNEDQRNLSQAIDSLLNLTHRGRSFNNKINYYIIDKWTHIIYGPLNKYEFNEIRAMKDIKLSIN